MRIWLPFRLISRFSAISRSSMKSFGRLFSSWSRFNLVKLVPSVSSKRFARDTPGAVRHIPIGFFRKIFSSANSSGGGMKTPFLDGMNTFPLLISSRCRGGRYIAFPSRFDSFMIWFMVVNVESVVESRRLDFTYLTDLTNKSRAPQKVRPKPINARMECS